MKTNFYRLKEGLMKEGFSPDKVYTLYNVQNREGIDREFFVTDSKGSYDLVKGELERDFEVVSTPLATKLHTIATNAFVKGLEDKAKEGAFRVKVLQTVPPDVTDILEKECFKIERYSEYLFISW